MSKVFCAVVAAAVLSGGAMVMAQPTSVTGVLVDKACYTKDKANTTNEHKGMGSSCAEDCARKGMPVALVTESGDVYTVTGAISAEKNAKLVPHMSHTVTLTGEVIEANGVKVIDATALKMVSK